jgi:Type II CAAX prenyl endopeptidase Rce1-like
MSLTAPRTVAPESERRHQVPRWASAVEMLLIYAGILIYIWRWQYSFPRFWMLLLGAVIASHFFHHDSIRSLGLTGSGLGRSARVIFPLAGIVFAPLVLYGVLGHHPIPNASVGRALEGLGAYAVWCAFQQYLTQSYFHRRLMQIIRAPWVNSVLVGVMFGSAHIPNPILMTATFIGGFVFAEVFRRHPNIWPLAVTQAVGGLLIGWVSPPALIHSMRVGPGYFLYHAR